MPKITSLSKSSTIMRSAIHYGNPGKLFFRNVTLLTSPKAHYHLLVTQLFIKRLSHYDSALNQCEKKTYLIEGDLTQYYHHQLILKELYKNIHSQDLQTTVESLGDNYLTVENFPNDFAKATNFLLLFKITFMYSFEIPSCSSIYKESTYFEFIKNILSHYLNEPSPDIDKIRWIELILYKPKNNTESFLLRYVNLKTFWNVLLQSLERCTPQQLGDITKKATEFFCAKYAKVENYDIQSNFTKAISPNSNHSEKASAITQLRELLPNMTTHDFLTIFGHLKTKSSNDFHSF